MTTKPSPDAPCDTRMMNLVHAALRRDLRRSSVVLADPQLHASRLEAVAGHLAFLADFLHDHHTLEDQYLYPQVRAKDPTAGPMLDRVDAEHGAVVPALERLRRRSAAPADRPSLLEAVTELSRVLDPHLDYEEREVMPRVEAVLTQAEWEAYDAHNVDHPKPELAFLGHWLIDGLPAEDVRTVTHQVPAVPRFVMMHLMGGSYRRMREAAWQGTAADDIGSAPLPQIHPMTAAT